MISVTLIARGYARVGIKGSRNARLVKISNAIEYIYSAIELTSNYIIILTRHYRCNNKFMDFIERTV